MAARGVCRTTAQCEGLGVMEGKDMEAVVSLPSHLIICVKQVDSQQQQAALETVDLLSAALHLKHAGHTQCECMPEIDQCWR